MEIAGPKIEVPDLLKFETARNHSLSNKIMSRLKDLEREYNELRELYRWNEFVEGFKIGFQTRLNQDYYLYESCSESEGGAGVGSSSRSSALMRWEMPIPSMGRPDSIARDTL